MTLLFRVPQSVYAMTFVPMFFLPSLRKFGRAFALRIIRNL
jgi:hypothetical protein